MSKLFGNYSRKTERGGGREERNEMKEELTEERREVHVVTCESPDAQK